MTKPISRKMAVDCLLHRYVDICGAPPLQCMECHGPILPGQDIQFDHIHADVHGGPHEYQNLRPIHYDPCHKAKSARDIAAHAKVKRIIADKPSKRPMKNSGKKLVSHSKPWGKAFRQGIGNGGLK